MPELPEVHTITSDLRKHVVGAVVVGVEVRKGYETYPNNKFFCKRVGGNKIEDVYRLAKNIVFKLSSGEYSVIHLAMTGRLLLRKKEFKPDSWERVVFTLEKDGKLGELRFCDKRKFGKVKLLDEEEFLKLKEKYGVDPLGGGLVAWSLLNLLQKRRTKIKTALMDQSLISGMGNVYVNDALWMAKIHPELPTAALTIERAEKLVESIREILKEGISNRGISMSDYVDLFGKPGKQQLYLRVYGKDRCERCETRVKMVKISGRKTFFCPICQPPENHHEN